MTTLYICTQGAQRKASSNSSHQYSISASEIDRTLLVLQHFTQPSATFTMDSAFSTSKITSLRSENSIFDLSDMPPSYSFAPPPYTSVVTPILVPVLHTNVNRPKRVPPARVSYRPDIRCNPRRSGSSDFTSILGLGACLVATLYGFPVVVGETAN